MGYRETIVRQTSEQKRIVGATCDNCGGEMPKTGFAWEPALVLRVKGGLSALYLPSGADTLELTYCYDCAHKLMDIVPGLKAGMLGTEE